MGVEYLDEDDAAANEEEEAAASEVVGLALPLLRAVSDDADAPLSGGGVMTLDRPLRPADVDEGVGTSWVASTRAINDDGMVEYYKVLNVLREPPDQRPSGSSEVHRFMGSSDEPYQPASTACCNLRARVQSP